MSSAQTITNHGPMSVVGGITSVAVRRADLRGFSRATEEAGVKRPSPLPLILSRERYAAATDARAVRLPMLPTAKVTVSASLGATVCGELVSERTTRSGLGADAPVHAEAEAATRSAIASNAGTDARANRELMPLVLAPRLASPPPRAPRDGATPRRDLSSTVRRSNRKCNTPHDTVLASPGLDHEALTFPGISLLLTYAYIGI